MTQAHVPLPDDQLDQMAYDVCARCCQPIRPDGAGVWRTMLGYSPECAGGAQR